MRSVPDVPGFARVLCISAHPDDLEFGAAGTVAALADEGTEVFYAIATSGQSGANDPRWTPETLAATREEESRKAAAACGVRDVTFLGFRDGYVEPTIDLRLAITREIRRHQPSLIIGMKPGILLGTFINHPDHRNVATAVLDSMITGVTTRLIFPELLDEGLEPWQGVEELWLMGPGPGEGDTVTVDITGTLERKIEALRCHSSQMGDWDPEPLIRSRATDVGAPHGYEYGERFLRLDRRGNRPAPVAPGPQSLRA
jgi:LmbE family N-acetylglucosaminyl deacetylase